jgi:cysteine-rich repeat protein
MSKLRYLFAGSIFLLGVNCGPNPIEPVCGNQEVEDGEVCDDGNEVNGDGCEVNCQNTPITCGNGIIDAGELCLGDPITFAIGTGATDVITGDFNDDQITDLAVAQGSIGVLLGLGNQDFTPQALTVLNNGDAAEQLAVADFNLDGVLDLAASNVPKDEVLVFFGTTGTQFTLQPRLGAGPTIRSIKTAFLDGDNQPDIFVANDDGFNGTVGFFFSQAGGAFPAQQTSFLSGGFTQDVIAVDLDGDGLLDLVYLNGQPTQGAATSLNQGDRTFDLAFAITVGVEPTELVSGDFDKDGTIDIVIAHQADNNVSFFSGKGDGNFNFQSVVNLPVGEAPGAIAVADVDNDSFLDVAVVNLNANTATLLLGIGSVAVSAPIVFSTGQLPSEILLEDINGDGAIDLLTLDKNSNQVSIRFAAP